MEKTVMSNKVYDKLGICVSGLCLVHCLVMPILLLAFPFLSAKLHDLGHDLHAIFAPLVILSAILAVFPHCKRSGSKEILFYAIGGVSLILLSFLALHSVSEGLEHATTIFGSILLIIAHIKNIKLKHSTCSDEQSPCSEHH